MAWFKRKNTAGPAVAVPADEPVAADPAPAPAPAPAPVAAPVADSTPAAPAPAPSASASPIVTTMMDYPLTLQYAADRAKNYFANREIVTLTADGYDRTTYGQVYDRSRQMASALEKLGIKQGDRVGTLAWNTSRHFELYLGVPCMGAVLHTLNLRLPLDQLTFIINDAADRVIFIDADLMPILEKVAGQIPSVEYVVVMNGQASPTAEGLPKMLDYEELLATGSPDYTWPEVDERAPAAMCYTSGTTGNPKGVVYSHRSSLLHALTVTQADTIALSERDVAMPLVPMFHVNCWGLPHAGTLVGCKLVLPGRFMTPDRTAQAMVDEGVTLSAGVPTLWLGLLQVMAKQPDLKFPKLNRVVIGGSACPVSLIQALQANGIPVLHAWGMTETSPIGTVSRLLSTLESLPPEQQIGYQAKQGRVVPGVELRIVDLGTGQVVPSDGETFGEIQVRGPWITGSYYHDDNAEMGQDKFMDGWFRTGDVATMDAEGYMQIVDRTKDVVKSGGEWISSVTLENDIMGHPQVMEAAVIALPHPKWQERPIAVVVPKPDAAGQLTEADIISYLEPRVAKWWLPDRVIFVEAIPKTSVGKFDKKVMRQQMAEEVKLGEE
ncbi:MAG TPA: long-chain fatty acid--CoA ligase [Ktedonobacterales bacterium]|nr:long-chain fatty acid--CoA ligase [Ktedonobacterales bacterium]